MFRKGDVVFHTIRGEGIVQEDQKQINTPLTVSFGGSTNVLCDPAKLSHKTPQPRLPTTTKLKQVDVDALWYLATSDNPIYANIRANAQIRIQQLTKDGIIIQKAGEYPKLKGEAQ